MVTPYRYQQRQIQEALRELPSLESGEGAGREGGREEGERGRERRAREDRREGGRWEEEVYIFY